MVPDLVSSWDDQFPGASVFWVFENFEIFFFRFFAQNGKAFAVDAVF